MVASDAALRALMRAKLRRYALAYCALLCQLSANLRAYYEGKLARIGDVSPRPAGTDDFGS